MPILRNKSVSAGALICLALALLVLPLRWLLASVAAAAFHEFCHLAAVRLCGGEILGFSLDSGGAVIEAAGLSRGKALFCVLAGPIGGLLLLFAARWFPAVAVCAFLQSAYNLLPIYPLDGGRALRCVFASNRVIIWTERLCLAAIGVAAFYAAFILKLGLMPILFALVLFAKKNSLQTGANQSTIDLP